MKKLEDGDVALCTVERIVGTTVFVKIEDDGEGTLIVSEVAPGRIRNLRDYISVGRKIVCKILKIDSSGNINVSLRRVTTKEKKEVLDLYEKEKSSLSILKSVVKEKADEIAEKIKKESSLAEFLQACRTSPEKLEKYMSKEETEKICKILQEKKEKKVEIKIKFNLRSQDPDGIKKIKSILNISKEGAEMVYLAAGSFSLKATAKEYKEANRLANEILEEIEQKAKKEKFFFQREK